jgi:hypothetical protein
VLQARLVTSGERLCAQFLAEARLETSESVVTDSCLGLWPRELTIIRNMRVALLLHTVSEMSGAVRTSARKRSVEFI